jgi:glutamine amidotransferase
MQVTIIDYGSGNLRSAAKAFERAGRGSSTRIVVSDSPAEIQRASHLVLPGVGAFADCMRGLSAVPGVREAMTRAVREEKRPFLGICVGMQLLSQSGHEHGVHAGLGWIDGATKRLAPADSNLKIPHMGWNELVLHRTHPLLAGIATGAHAYFVHSFHVEAARGDDVTASADHGGAITAMIARENIAGVQFHPEKSQATGLRLIANFLGWRP